MGSANVISMTAQPLLVSYLCFEIGGILERRNAELGDAVNDIPYRKLCERVQEAKTIPGDPSRLKCDSEGLMDVVNEFSIATLRNEGRKAALDSAVNTRQNIYFSKYANAASVISTIRAFYSSSEGTSKPNRLRLLSDIAQQQAMDLQEAYTEDGVGVVRATSSVIESNSSLESETKSKGSSSRGGFFLQESLDRRAGRGTKLPHNFPAAWEIMGKNRVPGAWEKIRFTSPADGTATPETTGTTVDESSNKETANGTQSATETQSATHVDYEYRTPYLDARARNNRAQVSLRDQQFDAFMFEQNIPHLEQIFENELASVDNDVYQLQLALLASFLISPVPGVVTGVYKNPGDAVNAGEPVMRIEGNDVVQLVANLVHYGPVEIGAEATVTTTLGGAAGGETTLKGDVVAARGRSTSGRWEVVVQVDNVNGNGNKIVPLGYCFDPEYTDVTIA